MSTLTTINTSFILPTPPHPPLVHLIVINKRDPITNCGQIDLLSCSLLPPFKPSATTRVRALTDSRARTVALVPCAPRQTAVISAATEASAST